jgi:hypothetical protein
MHHFVFLGRGWGVANISEVLITTIYNQKMGNFLLSEGKSTPDMAKVAFLQISSQDAESKSFNPALLLSFALSA